MSRRCLRLAVVGLMMATSAAPRTAWAQSDLVPRARKLDAQGDQEGAIALYRQALGRAPKSFDAHYGLARALDLKGEYAEAREHFTRAIEFAPDDGSRDQAVRMLGVSWTFTGNAAEAVAAFTRVFDRRLGAGDFAGAAEEANELGRVLLELKDFDGAYRWYHTGYQTALRLSASGREADLAELRWAHAQARIAIRRGRAGEARRLATRVKTLLDKGTNRDQQIQYPYLLGYIAFYANDNTRAIAELRKADQEDPFILLLLAEALERSGQAKGAHEYYIKVLGSTSHAVNNAFARPIARRKVGSPR